MRGIGGFLVLMGVGSFVLHLIGMEFVLVAWVDMWGPAIGTGIRIGMIVVGAVLWFLGVQAESGGGPDENDSLSQDATRYL